MTTVRTTTLCTDCGRAPCHCPVAPGKRGERARVRKVREAVTKLFAAWCARVGARPNTDGSSYSHVVDTAAGPYVFVLRADSTVTTAWINGRFELVERACEVFHAQPGRGPSRAPHVPELNTYSGKLNFYIDALEDWDRFAALMKQAGVVEVAS